MAASSQTTGSWFAVFGFTSQEKRDLSRYVTLVVEDGKEFKAHRRVLSEASPFFEKMLNSDMRESNEGVVRLKMLTELGMRDILEFIYTGNVQITNANNAQELIVMADYLLLPNLKTLAEKIVVKNLNLNALNAISTYYFAKKYRCKELLALSQSFILSNFANVAKTEELLILPGEEVKMWLSSDEIDVSAEEDVFKIIMTWIDYEQIERKKYFPELFREVRLVYVSRDYLHREIVTNDLVNDNEGCMDLVKTAMEVTDSKDYHSLHIKPRKSLEIPVLAIRVQNHGQENQILCYNSREGRWSRFKGPVPHGPGEVISCHGKFYFVSRYNNLSCYDSLSNRWTSLTFLSKKKVRKVLFANENEIYAWVTAERTLRPDCACTVFKVHSCDDELFNSRSRRMRLSLITKYKPETNSWEDITSFDLGSREEICLVAEDNFIYFLGGMNSASTHFYGRYQKLRYADRYDLKTNTWDKIADLKEPRSDACGAAAHGKIFIAGGGSWVTPSCEVYSETTNSWQYAKGMLSFGDALTLMCVQGKLYDVENGRIVLNETIAQHAGVVKCYDPDSNQWKEVTQIPLEMLSVRPTCTDNMRHDLYVMWWSMRFFSGCNYIEQASSLDGKECKRKCSIM